MSKRWIGILILLIIVGLIAYSIYRRVARTSANQEGVQEVPVVAARPHRGEIERILAYSGTLGPKSLVTLTTKVAGRIETILVKEGDPVRAGQILVQLEDDVVRLQMEQAASAFRAAQAQYEKAQKGVRQEELENSQALLTQAEKDFTTAEENFKRTERLFKEGAIAKARFEEAQRQYGSAQTQVENARRKVQMMEKGASTEEQRMAQANMKALEAQFNLARLQVDYTRIGSPISGIVARVFVDEGNMASQTTPILAIIQDNPLIIKIPIPERHYGEFKAKQATVQARIRLSALPETGTFSGAISSISPTIDPASRTFTVEVELGNPAGLLRAGMYANVEFVLERASDALLIPALALVTRAGKTGVFTVQQGESAITRFREVKTGISDSEKVQILEGLSDQDLVVEEGNAFLEDGQKISVQKR